MLDILFLDDKTGNVKYALIDISRITYVTPSEIGYEKKGQSGSCSFPQTEKIEICHRPQSRMREALLRAVPNA